MIKVRWRMNTPISDSEVCDWLEELVNQNRKEPVFELDDSHTIISFYSLEDAVAFRLRFGI